MPLNWPLAFSLLALSGCAAHRVVITPVQEVLVATAQGQLHARIQGDRAAPALVLVNGGPGASIEATEDFDSLVGLGFRVVSYEQRGAGRSSATRDGRFDLAAQVEDLETPRAWLAARRFTFWASRGEACWRWPTHRPTPNTLPHWRWSTAGV